MATIQRDGRTWSVDTGGIRSLKRRYTIVLDTNNLGANGEIADLTTYGIPAIGSVHPNYSYLTVQSYDIEEGEGNEKKLLQIGVNYYNSTTQPGGGEGLSAYAVEQYGWDSGTSQRDVTYNLFDGQNRGGPLLNSAGDPFDSVPQCDFPAPVFTKVMKTKQLYSSWMDLNCKINKNTIDAAGMECAPKTLIASVSVQQIFGDPEWKYRYTFQLRYRSFKAMYGAGTTPIEYGWDIPVIDTGMRELVNTPDGTKKPQIIMMIDQESKLPCAVTSPELLDGTGHKAQRDPETNRAKPYVIRVQAYEDETFPSEFYSPPPLET